MWDKYPQARHVSAEGAVGYPSVGASSATSAAPLTLDDDDVQAAAGKFLAAMVERYKDNPAMMGYDVWNEGGIAEDYSPGTATAWAIGPPSTRPTTTAAIPIRSIGPPSAATTRSGSCAGASASSAASTSATRSRPTGSAP